MGLTSPLFIQLERYDSMAKLVDYGSLNYSLLDDYKEPEAAIQTITGLLSFPIVETETYDDGIVINVFEKTLFGKKHRGYLSLLYIDDFRADTNKFIFSPGTPAPNFLDMLIGLEFKCKYTSYFVQEQLWSYELGESRRQLISYGLIKNLIDMKSGAHNEIVNEQFNIDPMSSSMSYAFTMRSKSTQISSILDSFLKFK